MKRNTVASAFLLASVMACGQPPVTDPTSKPATTPPAGTTPASTQPEPEEEVKVADLSLRPSKGVDFGSVGVGEEGIQEITVINVGERKATKLADASTKLGSFAYTGGEFPGTNGDCVATLEAEDTCTLEVVFAPSKKGAASASLKLSYNDGQETQTASISLKGAGTNVVVGPTGPTGTSGPVTRNPSDGAVNKTVEALGAFALTPAPGGDFSTTVQLTATKAADDDAISIIAIVNTSDKVWVTSIESPSGTVLSDPNSDLTSMINRSYENDGAQAVLIPQTPDIEAQTPSGSYKFRVYGFSVNMQTGQYSAATATSVEVYVVHTSKTPSTQLDVNLFFSGSAGVTASNAASVTRVKNAITTLKSLYASAGMTVVNTRFYDLPSGFQNIAFDDSVRRAGYKTIGELFSKGAGKPQGLNFYFIGDIDVDGSGTNYGILGVAGGIPGPGAFNDTQRSGVMVLLDTTSGGSQDELGSTMAHEGGHFLGLFHACERNQQNPYAACGVYDNISDTPNASSATSNVMYWASTPSATTWSSLQGKTLRRHPLVY